MNAEEALRFVDDLLAQQGKRLTDLQRFVFLGTWDGQDYKDIHQDHTDRCSLDHLKRNVGYQLWKLLSQVLGEKVTKSTLQNCVYRAQQKLQQQVQQPNHGLLQELEQSRSPLLLPPQDERSPDFHLPDFHLKGLAQAADNLPYTSWADAPVRMPFYGCTSILRDLNEAIRVDLCRLMSLYGISGVGKTAIAFELARQVMDQFEFVIWRSLKQAPLLTDLLTDLTSHLSHHQEKSGELARFMYYMANHRCLVILDGLEAILQGGVHDGSYQKGYENYSELLSQVGMTFHESCLIITGWENPKEVSEFRGNPKSVYSRLLKGVGVGTTRDLFTAKHCVGAEHQWQELLHRCWGHPLILSTIATSVREVFGGNVTWFLEQFSHSAIPDDLCTQLERQLERLSDLEWQIVRYLHEQDRPVSMSNLQNLRQQIAPMELMKVLGSLSRRALIEMNESAYSLQTVVLEYLQMLPK